MKLNPRVTQEQYGSYRGEKQNRKGRKRQLQGFHKAWENEKQMFLILELKTDDSERIFGANMKNNNIHMNLFPQNLLHIFIILSFLCMKCAVVPKHTNLPRVSHCHPSYFQLYWKF